MASINFSFNYSWIKVELRWAYSICYLSVLSVLPFLCNTCICTPVWFADICVASLTYAMMDCIKLLLKNETANFVAQDKFFIWIKSAGLLRDLGDDTSRVRRALIFPCLCSYCNSEQIQSILPCCCTNWRLFNICISHLPHSFKHTSARETNTLRETQRPTDGTVSPWDPLPITELYA